MPEAGAASGGAQLVLQQQCHSCHQASWDGARPIAVQLGSMAVATSCCEHDAVQSCPGWGALSTRLYGVIGIAAHLTCSQNQCFPCISIVQLWACSYLVFGYITVVHCNGILYYAGCQRFCTGLLQLRTKLKPWIAVIARR